MRVLFGITLKTSQQMIKEMIRSNTVKMPSVPKNAVQIFAPAAIATAVIMDVPPPVIPPYRRTTTGAAARMDTADKIRMEIIHFHHTVNILFLAKKPAVIPIMTPTGRKGKLEGLAIPATMLDSIPVTADTQGPQSIAMKKVPIASRYTGSFKIAASCPPTKFTATHTGIIYCASMVKSSLIELVFLLILILLLMGLLGFPLVCTLFYSFSLAP